VSFRALLSACVLVLGVACIAAPARAVSVIEPLAFYGWRAEPEVGSLGLGAGIGVRNFEVVPSIEYLFVDNANDWAVNVDGHFPILPLPKASIYVGGGATTYLSNPEKGDSEWNWGAEALIGAKMSVRRFRPFGELKYSTAGRDGFVLALGTRFSLR